MIIPYTELDTDTLNSLVQSFILREGTDYGNNEVSLDNKTRQILEQIYSNKIVIVYSELHETCDLVPANHLKNH